MLNDLKIALRSLRRSPGLTAAALITLALGIGATTAVFSVVDAVLLRALPYHDEERLMRVYATKPTQQVERSGLSGADFVDLRERVDSFEHLGAYRWFGLALGAERPRELSVVMVTPGLIGAMSTPVHGRTFLPEEGVPGQSNVLVSSWQFFQNELGGDPARIGSELILDGEPYEVVGVVGPEFALPASSVEIWIPWAFDPAQQDRDARWWSTVAKLAPGVSLERAQAEVSRVAASLEEEFPDSNEGWGVTLVPLREQMLGHVRPALTSLMLAVGLVLLIACANVANLLLARGMARQGELAVRTSLGAGRGRLLRQLLTESLVLAVLGGALGVLLARVAVAALVATAPEGLPRVAEIGLDGRVLLFALASTLVTGLIFGLLPALRLTGSGVSDAIRDSGRGSEGGRSKARTRAALAVSQLALSLLLLIGAGLMLRSFSSLVDVDPGFSVEERLAVQLFVYGDGYEEPESQRQFFERLFEEIGAVPGVRSVAGVSNLPMGQLGGASLPIRVAGRAEEEDRQVGYRVATRGYFETMGMRLVEGRTFDGGDREGGQPVALLNETAARQYFGEQSPLGERLFVNRSEEPVTIVGVVNDVRFWSMDQDSIPEMYLPFEQNVGGTMSVVVQTQGPPSSVQAAVEDRVWRVDPAQPVWRTVTLETLIEEDTAQSRFYAGLITLFAAVALALAAVGLYGVIAYSVVQRTREIGIRMAIGARREDIVARVLRDGSGMIVVGLVLGLILGFGLAIGFSKALSGLLFEVSPTDPTTFVGVSLVLLAVGLLACVVPALRASRVDPIRALHYE
jgi:putative ABC transport system permease protein